MPRNAYHERSARCSSEEFKRLFQEHGAAKTAKILNQTERAVLRRRRNLEKNSTFIFGPEQAYLNREYPHRATLKVKEGVVIVGSDFHIWPGPPSTALRAFKKLCKDLKPSAVILNGDVLDFPRISRHDLIGWESVPLPLEEIEAAQDHLNDIEQAAGKAEKIWTQGNHDGRFEAFLAKHASQLEGIKGMSILDHFAMWRWVWSCWINNDVVVKHRWKGGVHAAHNNTIYSGKSMITGHLHSQKISPFTDFNGTRYGVDTGCVAATDHKAFTAYTEDNPKNWVSGFAVLKFREGKLLYPQLVTVWDEDHVQFRGELVRV